jgi:hypothetical protein
MDCGNEDTPLKKAFLFLSSDWFIIFNICS